MSSLAESIDSAHEIDLFEQIERLKVERNAVILGHYYQDPDIQDISDVLGDSLVLARAAQRTDAEVIVFCGVHFMAETAKILNPHKTVVLPDLKAGCSLADSCPAEAFRAFKNAHPDHVVVSYINASAAIKTLSDWTCTSSNAIDVIRAIPEEKPILFAPDANLGRYLSQQTGRDMLLWPGSCMVHEAFDERRILRLLVQYPHAELIAHPECPESILRHAHFVGSTKALLEYTQVSDVKAFIVATEIGILHAMGKAVPNKELIPAAPNDSGDTCGCSSCPHMKLNTLEKVYLCLRDLTPTIELTEVEIQSAYLPIQRMLSL